MPVVDPTAADGVFSLLWLVIALPAGSARRSCCSAARATDRWGHLLGTALSVGSFVAQPGPVRRACSAATRTSARSASTCATWIQVGGLEVGVDLLYDPLSALFLLLITGVGSLIHLYSIGYMEHDARRRRFFGYLNLFVAAMLLLVLADNYLLLFLGWEGVGLASYLLIGFWQHKPSAAAAAKKAFVINRVGDMGLSLAIMLMFATFGTTTFAGDQRRGSGEAVRGTRHRHRPAAAARRLRQVRPGAAAGLAAGRDGGPDPGLGPDPRGDHGHRRASTWSSAPTSIFELAADRADRGRRRRPRSPCCGARSSAAPRTTSRRCWPAPR